MQAATLLNSVQKYTFLIAALIMQHTSGIILPVSKLMQKKELNIFAVIELIDSVWIFSDKIEAIAKTFFIKYLTKLRMNVKNMMLRY